MRPTPAWFAWFLVVVVAIGAAYLKFNRDASPLIYIPLVTVPALVTGYIFGGGPDENEDGRTTIEPEQPKD